MAHTDPLLIEGPKAETTDGPIIDLEAVKTAAADENPAAAAAETPEPAAPEVHSRWKLPAYAPLAAGIAFAVAIGALAGAATTSVLTRDTSPPVDMVAADKTRALQDSVAQLSSEIATLKAGIASAQRSTGAQVGKLTERIDRTEKAQAEPAAKIAKLQESVERLDSRQQAALKPSPEVTGSIAPPKEQSKPQIAEGWRLRDYYDGRAIVESRNGTLFKVGPGSNVPGLGKVETIKRENGKVVVVTAGGVIAASLEPRRPSYYMPRW